MVSIFPASVGDIDKAFQDLSRDMDPQFVHVFLDKLQRYVLKSDRELFLARQNGKIIGFATIIDHSPSPHEFIHIIELRDYACGTGLMVLPESRQKGVASGLLREWERWADDRGLQGVWLVTRKMAEWYQVNFHYTLLGDTVRNGVKKMVLFKGL